MRDKDVLDDQEPITPIAGVPGPVVPLIDDVETVDDQFPDEERDAGDEMIMPEDDGLLSAGSSPEFDHSLKRYKKSADE